MIDLIEYANPIEICGNKPNYFYKKKKKKKEKTSLLRTKKKISGLQRFKNRNQHLAVHFVHSHALIPSISFNTLVMN